MNNILLSLTHHYYTIFVIMQLTTCTLFFLSLFLSGYALSAPSQQLGSFVPINPVVDKASNDNLNIAQFESHLQDIYFDGELFKQTLDYKVFRYAIIAYYNALRSHKIKPTSTILAIVDYRKPSTDKRLYIVDIKNKKLLKQTWVSHGQGNGMIYAKYFSNQTGSKQTSLGLYRTGKSYSGTYGYSLRLDGLENGFNERARSRGIVIHGDYQINPDFTESRGMLFRSNGCFSLAIEENKEIIDWLKNGQCLFAYSDDINYLNNSQYLNFHRAATFFAEDK